MIHKLCSLLITGGIALTSITASAEEVIPHANIWAFGGPASATNLAARAMERVWKDEGAIKSATITLARGGWTMMPTFVSTKSRDKAAFFLHGASALYFPLSNSTPVKLDAMRPLARVSGDYAVVVAKAGGKFENFDELIAAIKSDPGSVIFAAGGPGQAEHLFFSRIGKLNGVEPIKMNFIPYHAGEVTIPLLNGQVPIAGGGYRDYAPQIESGELRVIAVAAPERQTYLPNTPTLRELGLDLVVSNWRGIHVHKDLPEEDFQKLAKLFDLLAKSPKWREFSPKTDRLTFINPPMSSSRLSPNRQKSLSI